MLRGVPAATAGLGFRDSHRIAQPVTIATGTPAAAGVWATPRAVTQQKHAHSNDYGWIRSDRENYHRTELVGEEWDWTVRALQQSG